MRYQTDFGNKLFGQPSYIYVPGTCLSSILGLEPSKRRPFPIKTGVIWVPGISIYIHLYIYIYILYMTHNLKRKVGMLNYIRIPFRTKDCANFFVLLPLASWESKCIHPPPKCQPPFPGNGRPVGIAAL